ncbi:MAG: 4Fe-4S dicluster domain-containing protein [Dehalococcoidia bacterium]|nr:4Fe-4S dicluster domain-containing protein [Dehalococcoidia bacterium]
MASGYIAQYGYNDGSGEYWITIDSNFCDGCGSCVKACPEHVFEVIPDDYDDNVSMVKETVKKKLKYLCSSCKPISGERHLACIEACPLGGISHSW